MEQEEEIAAPQGGRFGIGYQLTKLLDPLVLLLKIRSVIKHFKHRKRAGRQTTGFFVIISANISSIYELRTAYKSGARVYGRAMCVGFV